MVSWRCPSLHRGSRLTQTGLDQTRLGWQGGSGIRVGGRPGPVLFLDAVVAEEPQPLALTVLLGLKALLPGPGRLDVWREPPYLYRGWQGASDPLAH